MNIFDGVKEILADILDTDGGWITPETYLVRDLGAESIDLLEIAVSVNRRFGIEVRDEEMVLGRLRLYVTEAGQKGLDARSHVAEKYPFLSRQRVEEILEDLGGGPVLKVKDLVGYVAFRLEGAERAAVR